MTEPLHVLKTTIRIEVPVVFPMPPVENTNVSWDDLYDTAIERVKRLLPPDLANAIEEMVSLRGPGSTGHYTGESAEEIVHGPHLFLDFPDKVSA